MKFFALFIHRPVATTLLTLAIAISGAIGFRLLPVSPLPQVDFPVISISASLPGASPETMASSVATPLERALGRIAGVNEMTSMSSLGSTGSFCSSISAATSTAPRATCRRRSTPQKPAADRHAEPPQLPQGQPFRRADHDPDADLGHLQPGAALRFRLHPAGAEDQPDRGRRRRFRGRQFAAGGAELNPSALFNQGVSLDTVRQAIANANVRRPQGRVKNPQQRWQIEPTMR